MESEFSDPMVHEKVLLTLNSISETIDNIIEWNKDVDLAEDYYATPGGMQLLAANCTLITAIGEGVKRINRIAPDFLSCNFPEIPWRNIIGMRNHIAHGYFELDADIVFDTVKNGVPALKPTILRAIDICKK